MTKCQYPGCDSDAHHTIQDGETLERRAFCPPCIRTICNGADPLTLGIETLASEAKAEVDRTHRTREQFKGTLYRCYTHNPDGDEPGARHPGVTYVVANGYDEAAEAAEKLEGKGNWPLRIEELGYASIDLSTPASRAHELEQDRLDAEHALTFETCSAECASRSTEELGGGDGVSVGFRPACDCGSFKRRVELMQEIDEFEHVRGVRMEFENVPDEPTPPAKAGSKWCAECLRGSEYPHAEGCSNASQVPE